MLRPYRNGHYAQVLMNTAVFFTISDTKSKANANQIMYSAVRCRLPECGGFVLQRKDEGFTFIAIINDLTNHHHRHHHQNHHHDSHQVLTAAGNVGFANRSKVTQRCLHLPPCSRTRCRSAPCAPLCRCTHNPANFVLAGAWAWNQFAGDRRVEVVVVVMSHWHHHKIPPMTTWPSSSSPGQDCSTSCTQTTSCSSSLRTPGLEKLPPRVVVIGEVHSDIITRLAIRVNLIFKLWLATWRPDQMLPPRSALEKVVEFTEHNIKVLSKVEPGLTLT